MGKKNLMEAFSERTGLNPTEEFPPQIQQMLSLLRDMIKEEITSLRGTTEQHRAEAAVAAKEATEAHKAAVAARAEGEALRRERDALTAVIAEFKQAAAAHSTEAARAREDAARAKDELAELRGQAETSRVEIQKLQHQHAEAAQRRDAMVIDVAKLESQAAALQQFLPPIPVPVDVSGLPAHLVDPVKQVNSRLSTLDVKLLTLLSAKAQRDKQELIALLVRASAGPELFEQALRDLGVSPPAAAAASHQ